MIPNTIYDARSGFEAAKREAGRFRIYDTVKTYAAKIGLDQRTIARLLNLNSITAQARLTDGTLFDGSTLQRDYQLCVPVMRSSSAGYQRMIAELQAKGLLHGVVPGGEVATPSAEIMKNRGLEPV